MHVMMLATHDLKRSLKLILPRLQVASMPFIFNAFLSGNIRVMGSPGQGVVATKHHTVAATDGAEFFTCTMTLESSVRAACAMNFQT
ncbi:hypothetical protein L1987_58870 [Smallanthus sonchifolius]|uniref:Uncharacterized protein n=1 Tax=Smallanthus sonchifolius TaxID=185202 RepID=A0ACB9D3Z6_9ASTR|nr:hypothetical protein L1987_58870 [Smallanthus sonchifolius]